MQTNLQSQIREAPQRLKKYFGELDIKLKFLDDDILLWCLYS
jgi:hypothetical protein